MASTICTKCKDVYCCWSAKTGVVMYRHALESIAYDIHLLFSSSAQNFLLVLFGWFVRWEVNGHTIAVLLGTASGICLKQHVASLCSSHLALSSNILLKSKWCNHAVVLTWLQLGRIPIKWRKYRFIFRSKNLNIHLVIMLNNLVLIKFNIFLYHKERELCKTEIGIPLLEFVYLPNPSTWSGCDTRSSFRQNLTGLNSVFLLDWLLF